MTTVYGVTYVGARAQIERQLKDRGDLPPELCWELAAHLTKHVSEYLTKMIPRVLSVYKISYPFRVNV
jgi:DNA-directed RNA polymerase